MYKGDDPIEVSYSGGKDSDVILALTKMAGIPYRAIYQIPQDGKVMDRSRKKMVRTTETRNDRIGLSW